MKIKVTKITLLRSSVLEIFVATMFTVMLDSYNNLESSMKHTQNVTLASFIGENITYCCVAIIAGVEILYSSVSLSTNYFIDIYSILEDSKYSRYYIFEIKRY